MPVIIVAATASTAFTQPITVFEDDFNRADGAPGAPWTVSPSTDGDWGASIVSERLRLTNDFSDMANVDGWVSVSTPTSGFALPYESTLQNNPGLVTWSFNMRQIRSNPAGFVSGTYGVAFVLGATTQSFANSGSGYAVVLGNEGTPDPIKLVSFTAGLQSLGANTAPGIINAAAPLNDPTNSYLSLRVTYNPTNNEWTLAGRIDDGSTFTDPLSGTLTFVGSGTDSTHTGLDLDFSGMYWQGSTLANQHAFFDNITISVIPEPRTYALFGIAALLLLAGFRHTRRKGRDQ